MACVIPTRPLICALLLGPWGAWAAMVPPGPSLSFFQEDHVLSNGSVTRTSIGNLTLDLNRLRQASGLKSGYINVATAQGWVVRNLPVLTSDRYPYAKVNAPLDLGVDAGSSVTAINAAVDFSATPMTSFSGALVSHAVKPMTMAVGGDGAGVDGAPGPPRPAAMAAPSGLDISILASQSDHPNLEAADNQCFPMAVANSLKFLSNTRSLPLPHEHKTGLKGDNSLVGQLDTLMERPVTSRRSGGGTQAPKGLEGKLKYLAQSRLDERVSVRHWGEALGGDASVTVNGVTVKSATQGNRVDFDAVALAMAEGDNCELAYRWPSPTATRGGHVVDLISAGRIGGTPWILHASDLDQDSDSAGAGNEGLRGETLGVPDAEGYQYLSGSDRFMAYAICEKVIPLKFNIVIIEIFDPANHTPFVGPPPAVATLGIQGNAVTLTGTQSYMPFKGTVDAMGNFTLASTATVAGRQNVRSTFIGKRVGDNYEGRVVVGASGELNGIPLTYTWRVTPQPGPPQTAMRVNGLRQAASATAGEWVQPSISMKPGTAAGVNADWWAVAVAGSQVFHYDVASNSWAPGLAPSYTGPLVDLPYIELPRLEGLPAGTYTFYFGYDTVPNGQLDIDKAVYESTVLTIKP